MSHQPSKWILINSNEEELENYSIRIDSQTYLIKLIGKTYILRSLYKLNGSEEFLYNEIGTWRREVGFLTFNDFSAVRNRSNLIGTSIKITYVMTKADTMNHLDDYR